MVCCWEWGQSLCSICLTFIKMGIKIFPQSLQLIDASLLLPGNTLFFFYCFQVNSVETKIIKFSSSDLAPHVRYCSSLLARGFRVQMYVWDSLWRWNVLSFVSTVQSHLRSLWTKLFSILWLICMHCLFWVFFQSSAATWLTTGRRSWWLEEAFHWVSSIIQSTVPPLCLLHTHKAANARMH